MYTLRLLSGRRSKAVERKSQLHFDELHSFAVINSKNVANDKGDYVPQRERKFCPYDQQIVAEVQSSDYSVKSILTNGSLPHYVAPTGAFDRLQTSVAFDRYFGNIDESQLKIQEVKEDE